MDDFTKNIGIGGGAGVFGAVLSWLGFKYRVDNLQKNVEALQEKIEEYQEVRTCLVVHKGISTELQDIKDMQTEMRKDIKALLQRE